MFKLPQEIEVWYIIPRIRKELSLILISKGYSYEQTGKVLGITKAAVSQYVKNKRANKIKISKEIQKEIKISAEKIHAKESSALAEIQLILKKMKSTKNSCDVCKQYNKEILSYCNKNPTY